MRVCFVGAAECEMMKCDMWNDEIWHHDRLSKVAWWVPLHHPVYIGISSPSPNSDMTGSCSAAEPNVSRWSRRRRKLRDLSPSNLDPGRARWSWWWWGGGYWGLEGMIWQVLYRVDCSDQKWSSWDLLKSPAHSPACVLIKTAPGTVSGQLNKLTGN